MLKRVIDWILIKLRIKKYKDIKYVDPITTLIDILPIAYGAAVIVNTFNKFFPGGSRVPWYRRLKYRVRFSLRRFRVVVIGY